MLDMKTPQEQVVAPGVSVTPVTPVQPVAPVAPAGVTPFEQANPSLSTQVTAKEDRVAAVAYIAGQANYFIKNVIWSKVAIPMYKKLKEAEDAKPADKQVTTVAKLNHKYEPTGEEVSLTKEYSQTKFRSFFTDAYKQVFEENYTKVVLAETKPEYIVVKNLLDKNAVEEQEYVALNEKLAADASASNIDNGIFIIKRKALVAFMVATSAKYVPILCQGNEDVAHPNGKIIATSKKGQNGTIYDLIYIQRDMETAMPRRVKTLLEIGVPYAVNKDQTENVGSIGDTNKITNKEQVEELYGPKFNYKALGTRKDLKKANFDGNDDAYTKAKEDCIVKFGSKGLGKKFEEIGLTADDVAAFRSKKTRPGAGGQNISDLYNQHLEILRNYKKPKH